MKKILIAFIVLFVVGLSYAQTLTNTENYVYSKSYLSDPSLPNPKTSETVQYIDGLGRPKQVVNVKASPLGRDVVSHIVYDGFGRQTLDYLPVPQVSTMNGGIFLNPLANATQPELYGTEKIYAEKIMDNSPLNRVLEQKQVGNAWNDKPVKFRYDTNTDGEVRKYTATFNYSTFTSAIVLSAPYGANQLYKNTVTDEDGNQSIEFKNSQGQTILVRKMLDNSTNADTYYVYNDYNQLAFVIPPMAVTADDLDEMTLNNFCYQYKYDGKNRLVEKKLPGRGWEYMLYDKQDRLVATRDINLEADGKWIFTKYDQFGRVAFTGISTGGTRTVEQTNVNTFGVNNVFRISSSSFTWNGMDIHYNSLSAYPADSKYVKLLSVNYYDTYALYAFNPTFPTTVFNVPVINGDSTGSSVSTKGLPVMSFVKNIEDDNWTKNYTWYDNKGRSVASHSINHLGGLTRVESELDFVGTPLKTITRHKRLDSDTEKVIAETFIYDHQNRLKVHKHKVDNNPEEILAQNDYNELSQLKNKKVGGTNLGSGIQSVDYQYNIRGWLSRINDPYSLGDDLLGYELKYNNPVLVNSTFKKNYNGNISEVTWKTSNDEVLRRYQYQYDNLNRLTLGIFTEPDTDIPNKYLYAEDIRYDLNGNITELLRTGNQYSPTEMIDDLSYQYQGNRAIIIYDFSQNPSGYPGGGKVIAYDNNGNMKSMLDKGIHSINYNYQNLPSLISVSPGTGKASITNYTYRADGTKVSKLLTDLNSSSITDYLDGFQYKFYQGPFTPTYPLGLQFVPTSEGYFDFTKNKYIYNYTDHLGNVRLSYLHNGSSIEVLEENNYYPFGLKHDGYNLLSGNSNYQYKYNGKELQETGMYDYGARMYMPDIARWGVVDPLSEEFRRWSPYNYAVNNPINFIDPDGMAASPIFDESGRLLGTDDEGVKGDAIIMNKKDFTQGMAHSEALDKGTLASNLPESSEARQKADSFVSSASNRPDYDGQLTFNEANSWARGNAASATRDYGNGNLFVDVSKIDTSKFDYQAITSENKKGNYFFNFLSYGSATTNTIGNYLLESDNTNTGLIYGNVRLEITAESRDRKNATLSIGNRSSRLVDIYDFDTKNGSFMKRAANALGEHTATVGGLHKITPYSIYGYGNKTIKK